MPISVDILPEKRDNESTIERFAVTNPSIENPSPKQARNAAALTPVPSNGPQIYAETQAAYSADQLAAGYPRFSDDSDGDEAA